MAGTTTPIADDMQAADTGPHLRSGKPTFDSAVEGETQCCHRRQRPRIDLDESIAAARDAMKQAKKDMVEARRINKNEKRKKQRLLRKAAALSSEDLERIAVLKRCGLDRSDAQDGPQKKLRTSPQIDSSAGEHESVIIASVRMDKAAMNATTTAADGECLTTS